MFFCIPVFSSWFSIRISMSFTFVVSDSNVISLCLSGVSEIDNIILMDNIPLTLKIVFGRVTK